MLRIQITKRADGTGVLRCVRGDGSTTWQKQERHSAFFALHDLTHFAVESTLGFRRAFYGLIAEGWDIEDTTGKGAMGPLPDEAAEAEHLVGSFDRERTAGAQWTAAEFNELAAVHAESAGRGAPRRITEAELMRARTRRDALFAEWSAVPAGGTLELAYDPDGG